MLISYLHWLTFLFSLAFLLIYFKGGASVLKDAKQAMDNPAGRAYLVAAVLMALLAMTILLAQILLCLDIVKGIPWAEQPWIVMTGTILACGGILAMFLIRYRYLGRFWRGAIEIQEGHEVVAHGPYQIVRHPLYAFSLVIYAGMALVFAVWWNWLACGWMMAGYIWLTAHEDSFLEANLSGYREYQQRTRYRVVPGIW